MYSLLSGSSSAVLSTTRGAQSLGGAAAPFVLTANQIRERRISTTAASTSDSSAGRVAAERGNRGARSKSDLSSVAGVGKRNQQLLKAAGISSLQDLLCLYALQLDKDAARAQEYLRVSCCRTHGSDRHVTSNSTHSRAADIFHGVTKQH